MSADYVRWEKLRALSDEELRTVIEEGGPAAVAAAARKILQEREVGGGDTD